MPLHLPDLALTLLALAPAGVIGLLFGNWLRRATGRDDELVDAAKAIVRDRS